MTESQILDLLERAYNASCFIEVLKMIRARTAMVMIEKVIEKSTEKQKDFDFDWNDMFGAD
jgi:hypothetical protein